MSQLRVSSVTDISGTGSTYAPGHVVQVVSTPKTDVFTTASTTYTPITGLTASITPSSASSKILVTVQLSFGIGGASGGINFGSFRLTGGNSGTYKGVTPGSRRDAVFGGTSNLDNQNGLHSNSIVFLDSPSTTSAITYGVECVTRASGFITINRPHLDSDNDYLTRGASSITIMEIAQ